MNITENQRVANKLYSGIKRDIIYRDNPTNFYHDTYQNMINRMLYVFLVIMAALAPVLAYGVAKGIGMFLAGLATGAVLGLFGYFLVWVSVFFYTEFCYWIRGY